MRVGVAPAAAILLTVAFLALQVSAGEDIYWEGEEDGSNEFLEVNEKDSFIGGHINRLKRDLFDWFSVPASSSTTTESYDSLTDDPHSIDDETSEDNELDNDGSGMPERDKEPEPREKTLRVTFVVIQPYQTEYSNRDSEQFQSFSRSLADAVNLLYETLPGTQRASLVRIQSRISDNFSCKVTLDIVTSGYEDTDRITDMLRNHIRDRRMLGSVAVSDADFSANVIDPGNNLTIDVCGSDELQCDDGRCVPGTARCNGYNDCSDGADEAGCPPDDWNDHQGQDQQQTSATETSQTDNPDNLPPPEPTSWLPWQTPDRSDQGEEHGNGEETTPTLPVESCPTDTLRCDETRCVSLDRRCDRVNDCYDGTDEAGCELCAFEDFRCNDGKCIDGSKRCNRIVDCPGQEDEQNCVCREDEFRCNIDSSCIELRKRCDGVNNCPDNSDEADCGTPSCPADSFTCDVSSRTRCATRCDGLLECDGGEDEDNCDVCNHVCDGNRCIEDALICNGVADCADGSDEQECDKCEGLDDFRCKNGECLKAEQQCNDVAECVDGSDELNCNYTVTPQPQGCGTHQFQCRDGTCINKDFYCDNTPDCQDHSDEENCGLQPCQADEFMCLSGECVHITKRCDNYPDCIDNSDETDCPTTERPWTTSHRPNPPIYPTPYYPPEPTRRPDPYYPEYTPPPPPTTQRPVYTTQAYPHRPYPPSVDQGGAGSPVALDLKTYPNQQTIRNAKYLTGGDVVFQCRDEGPQRAPVRWVRDGGRPLKPGSTDRNGRLEMNHVSVSDSGTYICQAVRFLGYPGSEVRVELTVDGSAVTYRPPFIACDKYQATCGNGQCIPKSAICDGRQDCSDGSDEDNCHQNGMCEPNQFQCRNHKCVLKTWLCDSEDDCGDGSDEDTCGTSDPRQLCLPVEFKCYNGDQCVPKSFHCDGQSDCVDGSDEIGCAPVHVTKPPAPSNLRLNSGETLTLVCEAVGVPTPLISWRLNWGHVPPQCTSTSENGIGTLTCRNMQPEHSGAYSCEAINNKGTTFATPDSIVYVNQTDVCPNGFFNSEARSENECIRCFCFGESTQCRSADLFTYNMPTPLGEGGTRLVGIKLGYNGEAQLDSQPITDQYYYQALRNGATVTKLANYGGGWNFDTTAHPYLTLPETYNGNQLTSYGGHIKYRLSPHSPRYDSNDNLPTVIIKGKYQSLVHHNRGDTSRETYIEARLTPENWRKAGSRGLEQATREDIMMALDNIEMILLRADLNNAGVNITDFAMESAQHINVGLGSANLVEECICPPGYEGLSCQKCASGYVRERSGRWLGHCVREQKPCPPGTYGDPGSGYGCRPCPCPLTNPENQFARTCSIAPGGGVVCDCPSGYGGRNCEYCERGYIGNPMIPGDSCQLEPVSRCDPVGTLRTLLPDECQCKDQVQGRYCDRCKDDSFYLSQDFRHGCALCFCSGVSQQCSSSNLRRKTTAVRFNTPQIVDQVRVYSSAPLGAAGAVKYNAPVETDLKPTLHRSELSLTNFDRSRPTIYYWSLPPSFAGDKVTSYGGYLRYTLRYVNGAQNSKNNAADVQLISDNRLTFHYFGDFVPSSDGTLNASLQFLEKGWYRSDGKEISREHFLLALADVKAILIKATYTTDSELASLDSASIETAEANGNGPPALHVEQCICPTGYVGTSCEDCAAGYTRSSSGLYLEHCERCDCNGHSNMCHPETGVCFDCKSNTAGENCEQCAQGYERNEYQDCVPSYDVPDTTPSVTKCNCDPRGEASPCDYYCNCKQNVEGAYCDRCRPGTFGLDGSNPAGCLPCYCSGVTTECHEASHYSRIPIAAPIFGDNYGGYSITDLNAQQVINDQFVPVPNESELMYIFSFPPNAELFWSLPVFPGNRVLSYGGTLSLTQSFSSRNPEVSTPGTDVVLVSDSASLYWTNPRPLRSDETLSYQVPLSESGWYILNTATPASRSNFMMVLKNLRRVLVRATFVSDIISTAIADVSMDTATESYDSTSQAAKGVEVCICPEGYSGTSCESCQSGYYRDLYDHCTQCNCNGHDCQLGPYNVVVCSCRPPYTGSDCSAVGGDSITNVTTRPPPPESTVYVRITSPTIKIQEVGSSVNFTCQAQSRHTLSRLPVTWTKVGGYLPQGRSQVDQRNGLLLITNLQPSDSGTYICETTDGVSTGQAIATLKVPGSQMTLPTVTIEPVKNEYYEGDRIELLCVTSGNPTPRITWQMTTNRPLPLLSRNYESTFVIPSALEEDSGEYRCIASNTVGSTDQTIIVTVRARPSWPRDRLTVTPTASTVNEGQSTRLVCTGTTNMEAGTIDWIRQDGTELQSNVRSINGVLYITDALPENQGVYICQTATSQAAPVPVLVTIVPLRPLPPSELSNITVNVDRLRVPTGGSGSVDCNPTGYPLPLIRWRKHGASFGAGVSQRDNMLLISNAQEDDQGYYLCEGTVNGNPIASIYVFLEIEKREPPRVEIWPQGEQAVALGSQFELHCRVLEGVPVPDVTWDRNGGRPLSTFAQIQPHNILRFERVDVNDEGEYTCSATNMAGTHSASAVIKVRSPPEITITPTSYVQAVQGDPVTVECRANGYPEPSVSIRSAGDMREIVPPAPGMAVLRIGAVNDRDEGEYVCTASSPAGTIQEQFVIRVTRGDGGGGFNDNDGSGENEINPLPPYPDGPNNQIAFEGRDRSIECRASSGADVVWRRVDKPLQHNAVQSGSSLIIYNASKSDSGVYECSVIDSYTNEVIQSDSITLQIVAAPRITLQPKTQTVLPGQSPTVQCVVDGDDIIDVTWRPVDRPQSRRVEVRGPTLIFHQIEVEDAGQYECFARNAYANASAAAEVIVSEENNHNPAESHDNEQFAHVGAAVHLSCNVTRPNLRIRWTKDGRNVPRSVTHKSDGSLFIRQALKSDSGYYVCLIQDEYGRQTSNYINLHIEGPHEEPVALVSIEQPRRPFRVGENVEVLCRIRSRGTQVNWERYGNNQQRQYVETRTYGDGSMLYIRGVEQSDEGVYRCTGRDPYGRTTYEDFNLQVQPVSISPAYPINDQVTVYPANLGAVVDLPCHHNLEQPVQIEWSREYTPLPENVRTNEPNLHLERVTESDAGTYVCTVRNARTEVEARAILRVLGVVPQFDADSWLALPTLRDAFRQFDIEISFKPRDENGLILYNSQNPGRTGKYVALQLIQGIPQFVMDTGTGSVIVNGDRPLQLNTWHTIRISRTNTKVTMDVDNTGPFIAESAGQWGILELSQPLYIGGVPDFDQLPSQLTEYSGFIGCVSMLVLGREERNIMVDSMAKYNIKDCETCAPNLCQNNGVCQEARNERGYTCLCAAGFAGLHCERAGEGCRPGLCGPGKCANTADGYKCACPVTYTGRNCEMKQSIEYPAFTGTAYLAIKAPQTSRVLHMSMKLKATPPVTDGIIMYCAESARGYGGFISLAVHDGRLEFRYNLGDGSAPVILTSNHTLPAGEWTDVHLSRTGPIVSLKINHIYNFQQNLASPRAELHLETPMFVGGVDDSIVLNNNTGVTGGFNGCIKDVMAYNNHVDIVNSSIQSANIQECSNDDRGDIPDIESVCSQCRNGGYCTSPDMSACSCPSGYTGVYCESRSAPSSWRVQSNPCAAQPCRNGGSCRTDLTKNMNYSCDCTLPFAGANCHIRLDLLQSVGFNGNGYLELPSHLLRYDNLQNENVVIALAFYTTRDGVLLYQREALVAANYGDYILLRVEHGRLVLDWDFGSGVSTITVDDVYVIDGERHQVVVTLLPDNSVSVTVDHDHYKTGITTGLSNLMNADSNIYIGGIPDRFNVHHHPGLTGCVEQVELMDASRGLNLGAHAVAGRNPQKCRDPGGY